MCVKKNATASNSSIICKWPRLSFWKNLNIAYCVYKFPIATIRNYHKFSDLTQIYSLTVLEVRSLKSKISSTGNATFLPEALEQKSVALSFSASRGSLNSLAHGLFVHLQSTSFQPLVLSLYLFLSGSNSTTTSLFWEQWWSHWKQLDSPIFSPLLKSLQSITSAVFSM